MADKNQEICGTHFPFPFTPYSIQKDFMTVLYQVLEDDKIGIFESPTGTIVRAMAVSSENSKGELSQYISKEDIEKFMMALKVGGQMSEDDIIKTLKLLEVKILNTKMPHTFCWKITGFLINYLRRMETKEELEKAFTAVLMALGSHFPEVIIVKLWDRPNIYCLPPRSLMVAVGKIILSQDTVNYVGSIWRYIQPLLKLAQEENDMLAICHVFYGLVVSAQKHLDSWDDKVTGISQREMSMKAYITFRIFLNRWSLKSKDKVQVTEQVLQIMGHVFFLMPPSKLKNQVIRLTGWLMILMSTKVTPFYISQCICQLVNALALSGCGGINLESQLENITGMLFQQLRDRVNPADPHSVENRSLALRAFFILAKLYQDQMVSLLLTAVESIDPAKMESALQVFTDVFQDLPQTEKLQRMVLNSTIMVIQEDFKPVPKVLVNFIEMLGQHNYLALPQGNTIITYIIKLVESDSSNEEDIRIMCSRILQMVSLPKLVTLVCEPNNTLAFLPLCKAATQMALKASSLGQVPYLSSFHQDPTEYISPQRLLTHLVMCSRKPYREKEFGTSSLRLLSALHPITSLHPVINHSVGQLWRKVIPQMLEILDDHTEKSLNQQEWEDRLFRFLSKSLVAVDDDRWQEQLIRAILERMRYCSEDGDEKAFLYKFFGFALWTSRSEKLVKMMLSAILQTSHENLQEREGIAVAFSIVSKRHLKTVLEQLQVYSAILTDKESSSILTLAKEHQRREWVLVCNTIYLSYSKIILDSKGDIFMHFDAVLALILQHYHNCILEKDKNLKLEYLNALIILTKTLGRQQHVAFRFKFPHKLAIVTFMLDLIKEEPLNSISSPIRKKAMNIINNFRMLRPLLEIEERVELLGTCFKSVFCLPSIEVLQKEASSPKKGQANVDLFEGTMQSLLRLMETLIVEMPTRIQNSLQLMDPWLNSQKDTERERAMWCAARILEFTAKMEDFNMEIEFTRLGRLVKLLAMRCQDPVDSICFLSSKAVYNLYCILLKKKQMKKKIQGLWIEEDMNEAYSANLFYNNTFKIAEAFAEYFTQSQLTNLVLTAMEELTGSRAKVSLAAAQLMSAVMKKRGTDLIKIEEIVAGILERLKLQLEPNTKEETLRALCFLAGNSTHSVVPLLLNRPLPWDRTILAVWKVFGTERKTTINVLQLLIGILEKHSTEGTTEQALEPVEAACALCEMLSGSLCREAILELYPRLLLAVLCHLFWVIEQNTPQKVVVYRKDGGLGKTFDSTSCALEVVKLVLFAAAYDGVVVYADEHKCWDHLSSSEFYYIGIMDLTSGIVKNCEVFMLHRILNLAKTFLDSGDNHRKILARTVYAQLLWHRSVAQTLGQDFVGNLIKWTKEPNLIMKEIGLRGISNLALHPTQSEPVKSLFPSLRDFLKSEARVTVQAVKALRNIIVHGLGEEVKAMFCSISKHLRPLINDERDQVRITAISALGHMLHRVNKFKPGYAIKKHLYNFLVPLLLSLADDNTEVVKACGAALTEWTNVIGWSSFTQMFQHTTLSDHMQVLEEACNHLVNTCKRQLVGELLFQSFSFLKSSEFFQRTAALHFIALIAEKINLHSIHEDDVQLLRDALESMKNDPVESIQILVTTLLQNIEEYVNPEDSSTSIISTRFFRLRGRRARKRKRHLFKTVRREGDNDADRPRNWLLGPLNLLCNWCKGG